MHRSGGDPVARRCVRRQGRPPGLRRTFEASTVLRRLGRQEDISSATAFLASDDSAFMAGANLVIDGGWTAR
ncbi:MAG: SDR family oxidoreductase [Pseudomonadota bacterium]|uniref:SDR family oxidoreductase n=1 Tax=Paraburkholderia sp. TaxID=1926495 RepID=UPI003498A693